LNSARLSAKLDHATKNAAEDAAMTAYDQQNIFAKILRGEIPSHTILENDQVLAIMDVMPQADGHALVIPKRHHATCWTPTQQRLPRCSKRFRRSPKRPDKPLRRMESQSSSSMRRPADNQCFTCMCM
jgi:hypothetical protein